MMPRPQVAPHASRGVFESPFTTTADETILVAVNSRGQRIQERLVPPGGDVDAEWSALEAYLDQRDPRPLQLVRPRAS